MKDFDKSKAALTNDCAEHTFDDTTLRSIWARDKKLSQEAHDVLFKPVPNTECLTPLRMADQLKNKLAAQTAALQAEINTTEKAEVEKLAAATVRQTSHSLHKKWSQTANIEEFAKDFTKKAERSAFIT